VEKRWVDCRKTREGGGTKTKPKAKDSFRSVALDSQRSYPRGMNRDRLSALPAPRDASSLQN